MPRLAAADTLRIPAFRYFWGGYSLTTLANQMRMMIIAWLVLDLTNSQLWVGLVNGLPAFAIAAFALTGGVLVDRSGPKKTLVRVRLTTAVTALATALLVTTGKANVGHLLVLTLLASGVNGMDIVASQISLMRLVGRDRLLNALSLTRVANNFSQIVGPSLGGIVFAWFGGPAALWVLAVAFSLALLALNWFPGDTNPQNGPAVSLWRQLGEGFRYAGGTQHVRWLLVLGGIAIFPASFFPLLPGHARDTLNGGPEVLGFLIGGFGLGGLLGSVVLAARRDVRRKGLAMVIAALVWSLALAVLAFSGSFYLSLGCLFLIGVMWSIWMNNLNTLLQTTVPLAMQGRVISINKIVSQGGMAWLIGGLLGAALGLTTTFLLAGILFVALHLIAYWRTPELRQADRNAGPGQAPPGRPMSGAGTIEPEAT
jgi:MFS family permease